MHDVTHKNAEEESATDIYYHTSVFEVSRCRRLDW